MQVRAEQSDVVEKAFNIFFQGIEGELFLLLGIIVIACLGLLAFRYHRRRVESLLGSAATLRRALQAREAELDSLRDTQQLTLNAINAGVWDWEVQSGHIQWSPIFFRLLGYDREDIVPTYDFFKAALLHQDDEPMLSAAVAKHFTDGTRYRLSIRLWCKDGSYRWYETSGVAVKDDRGAPVRMIGSIIDITERMAYAQQLQLSNQTKDRLIAIISHDLRSPVADLKMLVEWVESGAIDQHTFMAYVDKIRGTVTTLLGSMDNLLEWASAQLDGFKQRKEPVKLGVLIRQVTEALAGSAYAKKIDIVSEMDGEAVVVADPDQLYIVVRNLLANAIKFSPTGKRVVIAVSTGANMTGIAVVDEGIGLDAVQISRLLAGERLASRDGTHGEKGSALGLMLVREMLACNKGHLTVSSEPGKRTSFTAHFPS